jgi:hypothetical protein
MAISFERFLTLTAALAAASASVGGCGGDDDATASPAGGSAGKTNSGGTSAGKAGAASGGQSAGGTSAGGKGGARGGGSGTGGSSGISGAGGEATESGGAGAGATGTGGSSIAGRGGVSGSENNGGESNAGVNGSLGGVSNGGEAGDHSGGAGAGGADEGPCFGDIGAADCFSLTAGDLPSDECSTGMNPEMRSCLYSQTMLRPGVIDGLGSCLVPITDPCTIGSADATDGCERAALRRACPNAEGADACANGIDLGGGTILPSPTAVCTDGTLTQTSCTRALSALNSDALQAVVSCADPAGYYGHYFSGTCAERLQFCVFPHADIYP